MVNNAIVAIGTVRTTNPYDHLMSTVGTIPKSAMGSGNYTLGSGTSMVIWKPLIGGICEILCDLSNLKIDLTHKLQTGTQAELSPLRS